MLKHFFIFQKSKPRSINLAVEEQVLNVCPPFCQRIHFMLNRMDHFALSLAPWFPGSHWWGISHSHSGPFVSAANFQRLSDVLFTDFSHLCYFLVHNNDPPTFIFFNDPLNGEKCPLVLSHVLMWTWSQKSKWFCLIMVSKGSLFTILQAGSKPRSKKEGVRGRKPRAG